MESQTCSSAKIGAFWDLRVRYIVSLYYLEYLVKLQCLTEYGRVVVAGLMRMITIDLINRGDLTCKLEVRS